MSDRGVLKSATMFSYFPGEEVVDECPCTIRLDPQEKTLAVLYCDHNGAEISYVGVEQGIGHWRLRNAFNQGEASLHAFEGSKIYEGYWKEKKDSGVWETGMWRIEIEADE
ncbi:hypothetical protein [Paracraurococcus lichenis]|uniref:Uncharacterized protein n=1 Tax=Paracraurococcus lichenis TaxID=3064888 RepID=A0ABT9DW68_9PROT|nr:hypothetical protein [Paracraurococcus sp. LOR1-02]MDO9708143.1 hypothetical protein [Paracraurococcus sp. LOR1-02]